VAAIVPPVIAPIPAPVQVTPLPGENPPTTPPTATAPAINDVNDVAPKPAKVKPKAKPAQPIPDKSVKTGPPTPTPAPVAPAPPPPAPVATPVTLPPAPKPVVQTPVTVSDALPFVIHLAEDVPADAPEGQTLHFTVSEGLQIGDKIVIGKGATVTGEVVRETGKKFLGIGGHKLTFRLTQVEAVDGRKLAVRAIAGKSEDGPTIRSFDTAKGSKPKGYAALEDTVYVGYIDGDQVVAVRK